MITASAELADSLDASFVGTGGLVGVAVAGGVIWVFGPSAIIAAVVVAGVAAGAITDAMIKHRMMTTEEYRFASTVFGDTLPARERFFITNLSSDGGRNYTWPNVDGSILLNLNNAFENPMGYTEGAYPTKGQVFIHELVHAWQIKVKSFVPGLICKRVIETSAYDRGPAGQPWNDKGLEQQAAIVDKWFGEHAKDWGTIESLIVKLDALEATRDPYFAYIANNIRLGQN